MKQETQDAHEDDYMKEYVKRQNLQSSEQDSIIYASTHV